MKKIIGLTALCLLLFTACETETASRNANAANAGTYVLTSLVADVAVDFNQDGVMNTELLNEATCFSSMDVVFMANGDFNATVALPEFDAMNNLTCTTSNESGTYSLDANSVMTINANVNGGTITEMKQVLFTPTTFEFTVSGQELDRYVADRNTSPASNITSLQVVYTKI